MLSMPLEWSSPTSISVMCRFGLYRVSCISENSPSSLLSSFLLNCSCSSTLSSSSHTLFSLCLIPLLRLYTETFIWLPMFFISVVFLQYFSPVVRVPFHVIHRLLYFIQLLVSLSILIAILLSCLYGISSNSLSLDDILRFDKFLRVTLSWLFIVVLMSLHWDLYTWCFFFSVWGLFLSAIFFQS